MTTLPDTSNTLVSEQALPAPPVPTQPAPSLEVDLVGGGRFVLADSTPKNFTLVVFYRGLHCPICRGYLAQLDRALGELAGLGVEVVAGNVVMAFLFSFRH